METMYERIKRMSQSEMKRFIYWVYLCGNRDGQRGCEDSPGDCSYFGGGILTKKANEVMPNDNTNDLWKMFDNMYGKENTDV